MMVGNGISLLYRLFQMKSNQSFQNDPVIKRANQNSNFRAIKSLVTTENSVRVAHNRIRALQANENKNHCKIQNQLSTIQRIQRVRQAESQHFGKIESIRKQFERQQGEIAEKNRQVKQQHRSRVEQNSQELREERRWQYLKVEEGSEAAQREIEESRSRERREKEENKWSVRKAEERSKMSLVKFYEGKQSRIKEGKSGEIDSIKSKECGRQKELRELGNMEMELISRQSQSQAAYLEVKHKLDSLLSTVKQQNTKSKKGLKVSVHLSAAPVL